MNKLLIPSILAVTVLIAGIFAFIPVDKATTVHDQIIAAILGTGTIDLTDISDSMTINDVFGDIDTATSANDDAIILDVLVTRHDGSAVTGLTAISFSTAFIAGTAPGDVTITVTDSGSGGYRITVDPTDDWDAGRTTIVLSVTDGTVSASKLVVVDIT